jgi:pimeloyl-ACP methyl ester carboxylesterase
MNDLSELEQASLAGMQFYQEHDSGYSKQQSTRPQTLGYGLADSPIGQAAWILEKFYQWMDCNGHPENIATRDELLDNVMLYWLTDAGASSARIYWESFGSTNQDPVSIPVGCSIYPKEIFRTSERWAKKRFPNLVHFNVLDKGGHFAAFEQPDSFVNELRTCFSKAG